MTLFEKIIARQIPSDIVYEDDFVLIMKTRTTLLYSIILLLSLLATSGQLHAQGTAFTYQGRLNNGTNTANGGFDFTFSLFNAITGGSQAGPTLTNLDVSVSNGLFIVTEDFGAVYNGTAYWLQIGVRTNGGNAFTALSPRQTLTPTPYAVTASNITGTLQVGQLSGTLTLSQLPGAVVTNSEASVTLTSLTLSSNLTLPSSGIIDAGGSTLLFVSGNENFYAGPNAGSATTSGAGSTGIGYESLQSNTNGTNNTAIGYQTLNNNTNGSYNVAIGERTLFNNTSGNDNTADGRHALEDNTTGNDNTADGYSALSSSTTGSQNTAIGSSALASILRGSNNIVLGYQAGSNYGEGESSNILIGSPGVGGDTAIIRIGSGQTSTFVAGVINGNGAGLTNLSVAALPNVVVTNNEANVSLNGLNLPLPAIIDAYSTTLLYADNNNNTFFGLTTFGEEGNGNNNTGIGNEAMDFNSSGSYNTAVGVNALDDMFETCNYNIALGYNAGSELQGGSNNIYIGNVGGNESGVIRIGTPGTQTQTFIAGTIQNPSCTTLTITGGSDLAEPFPISNAGSQVSEGAVVVIDEQNPGHLKLTDRPYDTRVAGVVSGANGINPGIQMQQQGLLEGGRNVALTGRVYVQADTSNGPIKPGDLLTTSSMPGRAMKVTNHTKAQGAILGKAMTGLKTGQGMVLVLVTLQ
jgi:hypothetical protein